MMTDIFSACSNKGCGKQYSEPSNTNTACEYHFGEPVFHEGLKGWSCCPKKTPDFEEFLKIPGCVTGKHSSTAKAPIPKAAPAKSEPTMKKGGVEVYGSKPVDKPSTASVAPTVVKPVIKESELFDPKDTVVKIGTKCQRPGCTHVYDGASTKECVFHQGTPVFHEGSKSWSCCPRKVLEFEDFLKLLDAVNPSIDIQFKTLLKPSKKMKLLVMIGIKRKLTLIFLCLLKEWIKLKVALFLRSPT